MNTTVQKEMRPAADRAVRQSFVAPEVNIFETKDGYVLEAEMPGVNKEGLEITLEGNEITIVGTARMTPRPGSCCSGSAAWQITVGCSSSTRPSTPPKCPREWSKEC